MTTPVTGSCPAWCRAAHERPGRPHFWNVASIGRAGGALEAEVNLMADDQGAYVQVGVIDHAAPEASMGFSRFPVELAAVWAQIASEMDVRGALEVGQALMVAVKNAAEAAAGPGRLCRFSWCEADHAVVPGNSHWAVAVKGATTKVMQFWVERSQEPEDLRFVRLHYGEAGQADRWRSIELEAAEAADVADFLQALGVAGFGELEAALRRAAADLGVAQ